MSDQDKDSLLAAEYVLGVVDELTRARLDKLYAENREFAADVTHWQRAFSGIDMTTPEVTPTPEVWQRIERSLGQQSQAQKTKAAHRQPLSLLGWALAAALAGILIFTHLQKPPASSPMQPVAVLSGSVPNAQFVVSVDKSSSLLQVSALNVTLPQNNSLQLWLIRGSTPPRSLGLITQREHNEFQLNKVVLDDQTVLAISLEPVGGSKLAGPSGPVLFQGKISQL
ncbi:anti-sigma factor [Enterobacteriaceae bacterium 89]|nr:anti-sigma factor [Enterobacteriaceae bacterium 89]